MKVLIYKRTHRGDPDNNGVFGNEDCMGRIRNWNYDAVIGIGGKSPWKGHEEISHKINWIGLEPKRIAPTKRGDRVVFKHFELFEGNGKDIKANFPNLYEYMYTSRKRFDMSSDLPENVFKEVLEILDSIKNSNKSKQYSIENVNYLETKQPVTFSKCGGCFEGKNVEIEIEDYTC